MCAVRRANTKGLLALWLVNLSYASYTVMLQHVLSTRPFPFSVYSLAATCGDAGIIIAALPQFRQVRTPFALSVPSCSVGICSARKLSQWPTVLSVAASICSH